MGQDGKHCLKLFFRNLEAAFCLAQMEMKPIELSLGPVQMSIDGKLLLSEHANTAIFWACVL
jgi:hypothetical protein